MVGSRPGRALFAVLCLGGSAAAQPGAPAPTPAPAPAPAPAPMPAPGAPQDPYAAPAEDPVLAEQIAEQLVSRAQELLDAKIYLDAKQLAVEALVKSPKGNAAERARLIIKTINQQLGIKDDPAPVPPSEVKPTDQVDLTPIDDPTRRVTPPVDPATPMPPEGGVHDGSTAAMVHGGLFGGMIGAAIGGSFSSSNAAAGAVPVGIGLGLVGGLVAPRLAHHYHLTEAQIRIAGSGSIWGGAMGAFLGDVASGANGGTVDARSILLGMGLGATGGGVIGAAVGIDRKPTRGDVALVDTLSGIGAVGGLTVGMLMQPAQAEAYALNAALGAGGGFLAGVIAAPQTNTTPRRMLRVAGFAALGGALPFLLYAGIHDNSTASDERVVGLLSSAGLVGGAYLGFRLTRDLDVGLDVPDHKPAAADAPPAVVGRSSDGSWGIGGLALAPLSRQLATGQHGAALTLVSGAF